MSLDDILRAYQRYASSPRASLSEGRMGRWVVVACSEARLNDLLSNGLGLSLSETYFVRTGGNAVTDHDNSILRSCAAAVVSGGCDHILVLGHTPCEHNKNTLDFSTDLSKRGIPGGSLSGIDLRDWFGLISSETENVRKTVEALMNCPGLPEGTKIYGVLFDSRDNSLKLIREAVSSHSGAVSGSLMTGAPISAPGPMKIQFSSSTTPVTISAPPMGQSQHNTISLDNAPPIGQAHPSAISVDKMNLPKIQIQRDEIGPVYKEPALTENIVIKTVPSEQNKIEPKKIAVRLVTPEKKSPPPPPPVQARSHEPQRRPEPPRQEPPRHEAPRPKGPSDQLSELEASLRRKLEKLKNKQ
jgi:carbonic anhydrase